jgi:hypothetical protein
MRQHFANGIKLNWQLTISLAFFPNLFNDLNIIIITIYVTLEER